MVQGVRGGARRGGTRSKRRWGSGIGIREGWYRGGGKRWRGSIGR